MRTKERVSVRRCVVSVLVATNMAIALFVSPGFATPTVKPNVQGGFGQLPLSFELNQGQAAAEVKFLSRGPGYTIALTPTETIFALRKGSILNAGSPESRVLRMRYVGRSDSETLSGLDLTSGRVNYYIGADRSQWRENIPTYGRVLHQDVYHGVDLVFYGRQGQLEYDFVIKPGASPRQIGLAFDGADRLEVDRRGDLLVHIGEGVVKMERPRVYQDLQHGRRYVAGAYMLVNEQQVAFRVGDYDTERPLIIDPTAFYSTYLGGSAQDEAFGIAMDASGNALVTGITASSNFPTASALQTHGGGEDVFVTKLNPTGTGAVFSTYLGGVSTDRGRGIAVHAASGTAYVTGNTASNNFPTTPGAYQTTLPGVSSIFITKLGPSGSLMYSTYLGGSNVDAAFAIAVDAAGNAYVTGQSSSPSDNPPPSFGFPTTPGAYEPLMLGSGGSAYAAKLNPAGSGNADLVYSTFLSSVGDISNGFGIGVDNAGNAYIAGLADSNGYPTTDGTSCTEPSDTFVTKVNPTGTTLVYSTCFGGSLSDNVHGIAVEPSGNAYVTGQTNSSNYPVTSGAYQTTFGGIADGFVTKLNSTGSLVYSTFIGASEADNANSIAVDSNGNAYITGLTTHNNYPVTPNATQPTFGGAVDAVISVLNPTGTALVFSSFLGGNASDEGRGIALDSFANIHVAGYTESSNFPVGSDTYQATYGGGTSDAFVSKIVDVVVPPDPQAGKVTGGGTISVAGGKGNFGFIVARDVAAGPIDGKLTYVNYATGANIKSTGFTAFSVTNNTATFEGSCTNNGTLCTFNVSVEDNGEPGASDKFTITVSAGSPEGGTLSGGNIKIHE